MVNIILISECAIGSAGILLVILSVVHSNSYPQLFNDKSFVIGASFVICSTGVMVVYCLLFEGEIDAIDMRRMLPRIVGVSAIVAIFLVVIVIGSVFIFTGGRKKDDNKSIAATGNALDLNAIDFDITAPNLEEVKIVAPPAHKKRSNADLPLSLLRECKQYKEIKALIDRGELNESNNNGKVVINIELETREANAFVAFACALRQRTVLPEMEARDTIYVVPAINIIADTIRQSEEARQ